MGRKILLPAMAVLALVLTGCGSDVRVDPNLTVNEAKAIAQSGELRIVDQIPANIIESVDQLPQGTLLSCEGERNYRWAGGTTVALTAGADVDSAIDAVVGLGDQDGWTAQRETSAAGGPRVAVTGPDDDGYIVDGYADTREVNTSSISPCFHLPDGVFPGGKF